MPCVSTGRVLAGLTVAGLTLAVGVPAAAAQRAADIKMTVPNVSAPIGGPGAELRPSWYADQEVQLTGAKLTYELSGLTGVALFDGEGSGECLSDSPTKLVCSLPYEMSFGPDGVAGYMKALVKADETARPDTSGMVTATFAADGVAPITETARVRVSEGVDLEAGDGTEMELRPGQAFTVPLVVRNAGATVVEGASVIFHRDYAFQTTTRYSNCRYRDGELVSCTFDQALQPGTVYSGLMPYRLRADTYAPGLAANELEWLTPDELDDRESQRKMTGTAGTGGVLKLVPREKTARQSDINPDNNWTQVLVRSVGEHGADLAAVGATARGKVGDQVTVKVGVTNRGPATLDWGRSGESITRVTVAIPKGAAVVSKPEACQASGTAKFVCTGGWFLKVKTSETYAFVLRITKVIPNASAPVVVNGPCECSQFGDDLDPANNVAAIVLNGAGGGGGGGLPVTGPTGAAVGGAGLALLIAGGAGIMIARRKRTTFVA